MGISLKNIQIKKTIIKNKKTLFGFTGSPFNNKNYEKLIQLFLETFKDNDNVELVIHSNPFPGRDTHINNLKKYEKSKKIKIIYEEFSNEEYTNFLTSLDFFISLSNREGYSLTAREAISLGIPCLLTKSKGHLNLINNENALGIDVEFKNNVWEPLDNYVKKQLIYAFENKELLSEIAINRQYKNFNNFKWKAAIENFINFINLKQIIYGNENLVSNEYLMTNDIDFYEKIINL